MISGSVPEPALRSARPLALSPSRANDFKTCPLLYRFRAIDRLPEPPSAAAARGTLVHAVLEELFGRQPADRTEQSAVGSLRDVWERLSASEPELADVVRNSDEAQYTGWLEGAARLVRSYFVLEDPRRFSPEFCESKVEISLPAADGGRSTPLKGVIDRIDVAPTGELRIVDYKTGRAPSEHREIAAFYQLKFYALMVYRLRGIVPTQLKLIYLADPTTLTYRPDVDELISFQRGLVALWQAIADAVETADFPPHRSSACRWCAHRVLCPEFGGTPPALPGIPPDTTIGPDTTIWPDATIDRGARIGSNATVDAGGGS